MQARGLLNYRGVRWLLLMGVWIALFVTSHVKFTLQIQRFGDVFWHNACHYTRTLFIQSCTT